MIGQGFPVAVEIVVVVVANTSYNVAEVTSSRTISTQ
jgi:hypothetical protein